MRGLRGIPIGENRKTAQTAKSTGMTALRSRAEAANGWICGSDHGPDPGYVLVQTVA